MAHSSSNPLPRRRGRPPSQQAGLVEDRVLTVATTLFLERGFGRTTLDLVAQQAKVGKSSLYTRYPSKDALFEAVVSTSIRAMFDHMSAVPARLDLVERLQAVGEMLIDGMLHPRCVALMRITAAEAGSFPGLALRAYQVSLAGAVERVVAAFGASDEDQLHASLLGLAHRFVELTVQPLSFQAAFGVDPEPLRLRAPACVRDAIELLQPRIERELRGCRVP
jgi:AcrR family transcriptional regulator